MKNTYWLTILLFVLFSCNNNDTTKKESVETGIENISVNNEVVIYYFHGDRRCASCIAIEDETKKILSASFKADCDNGKIIFKDINIDKEENFALAEKYQVAGSALLVIAMDNGKDKEILDLTGDGFKFALNKPEIYNEKLSAAINSSLNK